MMHSVKIQEWVAALESAAALNPDGRYVVLKLESFKGFSGSTLHKRQLASKWVGPPSVAADHLYAATDRWNMLPRAATDGGVIGELGWDIEVAKAEFNRLATALALVMKREGVLPPTTGTSVAWTFTTEQAACVFAYACGQVE